MQRSFVAAYALPMLIALAWFGSLGCVGQPAPLVARAGTTIGLAIGGESPALAYGTEDTPDPQRGYMQFRLYRNDNNNWGTLIANLRTRLVTRTFADPSSQAAIEGVQNPFGTGGSITAAAQVLALVDIPSGVPTGTYRIKTYRYEDPDFTSLLDNSIPDQNAHQIEILTSNEEDFTPFLGTVDSSASLAPWPKLVLNLPNITNQPWPAAATIRLGVPSRVEVHGAVVNDSSGNGALVTVSSPSTNVVEVHYANPEADSGMLALVFELVSYSGTYDPVATTEFTYQSGSFYDADGNPMVPPGTYTPIGQIR